MDSSWKCEAFEARLSSEARGLCLPFRDEMQGSLRKDIGKEGSSDRQGKQKFFALKCNYNLFEKIQKLETLDWG